MASTTASEPDAGSSDHLLVHVAQYLLDRVHQAGLGAMGMSIGIFLNLAPNKIVQRIKVRRVRRPQILGYDVITVLG